MAITDSLRKKLAEKLGKSGRKGRADTEAIVHGYLGGETVEEVASRLGLTTACVYRHLRKARDGEY